MRRQLKFMSDSARKILEGLKTETRRRLTPRNLHFKAGDTFVVNGHVYRVVSTRIQRLGEMSNEEIAREGYNNREQFADDWRKLHPRKGYDPRQEVLVLRFEPAGVQNRVSRH